MKFIIENSDKIGLQELIYIEEECSFYMEYTGLKIDMELIVNKIALQVSKNKIVDLSGFCGLDKSMLSSFQTPEYRKGILKVEHNLNFGFAYGINDEELPVYVNVQSGWVCIGNPEKKGCAVEFINNCVAVIDINKEFISLWLKPEKLPTSVLESMR
jgi:hypothetical protein